MLRRSFIGLVFWSLISSAVHSQNLVENATFDTSLSSWFNFAEENGTIEWSPLDSSQGAHSGSMLVTNQHSNPRATGAGALQVVPVAPSTVYSFAIRAFVPSGQQTSAEVTAEIQFRAGGPGGCADFVGGQGWVPEIVVRGVWASSSLEIESPPDAECALIALETYKDEVGGSFQAYFDDVKLQAAFPEPPSGATAITSEAFPDFRFWVRFGDTRIGTAVEACPPETVCAAGALPKRTEVLIRIVGPKPNGYLWPTVVKFNTTKTEVWIRQLSSNRTRYYLLPALPFDSQELPGLVDKTGFQP